MYLFPFGQLSWLMGVEFVNRSDSSQSSRVLDKCQRIMTDKGISIWVYPEGTRSYGKGIQQFKRGAFKIAIAAQAPVIPVVISPYHFMDYKNKSMGKKGHAIISVLEPIPSKGWTLDQVDQFAEQVRQTMIEEYGKLDKELHHLEQDPDWNNSTKPRRLLVN